MKRLLFFESSVRLGKRLQLCRGCIRKDFMQVGCHICFSFQVGPQTFPVVSPFNLVDLDAAVDLNDRMYGVFMRTHSLLSLHTVTLDGDPGAAVSDGYRVSPSQLDSRLSKQKGTMWSTHVNIRVVNGNLKPFRFSCMLGIIRKQTLKIKDSISMGNVQH